MGRSTTTANGGDRLARVRVELVSEREREEEESEVGRRDGDGIGVLIPLSKEASRQEVARDGGDVLLARGERKGKRRNFLKKPLDFFVIRNTLKQKLPAFFRDFRQVQKL